MSDKLYWHWLVADRRLRYGDRALVEVGKTFSIDEPPALCEKGFHASTRAIDALNYAPGPIVCRVTLGGKVIVGHDKVVAQRRTVVWMADASDILHEFGCWCAETALRTAKVEDARCWAAIATKRQWLRGEASNEELTAARSAAESAAESAAWSAAESAARSAAWSAARSAARSAQADYIESALEALA